MSPMLPTVANGALGLLWAFSALGGWGVTAFCGVAEIRDPDCADAYTVVALISMVPAGLAVLAVMLAWGARGMRRTPERMDAVLMAGILGWIVAGAILFAGGYLARL